MKKIWSRARPLLSRIALPQPASLRYAAAESTYPRVSRSNIQRSDKKATYVAVARLEGLPDALLSFIRRARVRQLVTLRGILTLAAMLRALKLTFARPVTQRMLEESILRPRA